MEVRKKAAGMAMAPMGAPHLLVEVEQALSHGFGKVDSKMLCPSSFTCACRKFACSQRLLENQRQNRPQCSARWPKEGQRVSSEAKQLEALWVTTAT
eukprot:867039-Amphidinium_carterae.1